MSSISIPEWHPCKELSTNQNQCYPALLTHIKHFTFLVHCNYHGLTTQARHFGASLSTFSQFWPTVGWGGRAWTHLGRWRAAWKISDRCPKKHFAPHCTKTQASWAFPGPGLECGLDGHWGAIDKLGSHLSGRWLLRCKQMETSFSPSLQCGNRAPPSVPPFQVWTGTETRFYFYKNYKKNVIDRTNWFQIEINPWPCTSKMTKN